jgi:hypothetical protein
VRAANWGWLSPLANLAGRRPGTSLASPVPFGSGG